MKNSTILKWLLVVAIIVVLVYLYSTFKRNMEQSIGQFMTWAILIVIVFVAGWLVGRWNRRSHKHQQDNK